MCTPPAKFYLPKDAQSISIDAQGVAQWWEFAEGGKIDMVTSILITNRMFLLMLLSCIS